MRFTKVNEKLTIRATLSFYILEDNVMNIFSICSEILHIIVYLINVNFNRILFEVYKHTQTTLDDLKFIQNLHTTLLKFCIKYIPTKLIIRMH